MKASIGSVEYITSLFLSDDESRKVREAVSTSSFGGDFVRAALSVNNKVVSPQMFCKYNELIIELKVVLYCPTFLLIFCLTF